MPRSELLRRAAITLCFACLSVSANADDNTSEERKTFEPRTFDAAIKPGEIFGWEQVRRIHVTCGTNEFVFVVPQTLRVTTTSDKITLAAADSSYFLTFRILNVPSGSSDACRQHVLVQHPRATIVDEIAKTAAGHTGPTFNLRDKALGKLDRTLRVAMIPSRGGTLEFSFNADLSKSAEAEIAFNSILRTFRSNERGKIQIEFRTTDKS